MGFISRCVLFASTCGFVSAMTASLVPSILPPAQVGDHITWQASPEGSNLRYRFRVRAPLHSEGKGVKNRRLYGGYQVIRDYNPDSSLDWAEVDHEGVYEMEVSVLDVTTGETAAASELYTILPRVVGDQPVVSQTSHPLVFLFSAPACPSGSRMRVAFGTASSATQQTPWVDCETGWTRNFFLAGLYGSTSYTAHSVTDTAGVLMSGPEITFQTGDLPAMPWTQTPVTAGPAGTTQPVLLATSGGSQIATDMQGNVVWYNPSPFTWATRPEAGGYLWGVMEDMARDVSYQAIRKVDLTGMTVLETNAEAVNGQLAALGKRTISGFHHEVRTINGGRIVALAGVEQILTDVQGPGQVDVMGDMIIVLDHNLQVVWTWDTFDHLDPKRPATTGDVCTPSNSGCPAFYLATQVNDWTHGNAVQWTPDGNLLYSTRHQDWLIKIDYANGTGSGNILWKLGKDGDFTYLSDDPYPWFSHQHDGNIETADPSRVVVFDNGNLRYDGTDPSVHSRGQVIELDTVRHTAKLVLNQDLGVMSFAVGSAKLLDNGNYHFLAGFIFSASGLTAEGIEVEPSGKVVSQMQANTGLYRSFRMTDIYAGD